LTSKNLGCLPRSGRAGHSSGAPPKPISLPSGSR
jgi:hypothetical protein